MGIQTGNPTPDPFQSPRRFEAAKNNLVQISTLVAQNVSFDKREAIDAKIDGIKAALANAKISPQKAELTRDITGAVISLGKDLEVNPDDLIEILPGGGKPVVYTENIVGKKGKVIHKIGEPKLNDDRTPMVTPTRYKYNSEVVAKLAALLGKAEKEAKATTQAYRNLAAAGSAVGGAAIAVGSAARGAAVVVGTTIGAGASAAFGAVVKGVQWIGRQLNAAWEAFAATPVGQWTQSRAREFYDNVLAPIGNFIAGASDAVWQHALKPVGEALKSCASAIATWGKDTAGPALAAFGRGIKDAIAAAGRGLYNAGAYLCTTPVAHYWADFSKALSDAGSTIAGAFKQLPAAALAGLTSALKGLGVVFAGAAWLGIKALNLLGQGILFTLKTAVDLVGNGIRLLSGDRSGWKSYWDANVQPLLDKAGAGIKAFMQSMGQGFLTAGVAAIAAGASLYAALGALASSGWSDYLFGKKISDKDKAEIETRIKELKNDITSAGLHWDAQLTAEGRAEANETKQTKGVQALKSYQRIISTYSRLFGGGEIDHLQYLERRIAKGNISKEMVQKEYQELEAGIADFLQPINELRAAGGREDYGDEGRFLDDASTVASNDDASTVASFETARSGLSETASAPMPRVVPLLSAQEQLLAALSKARSVA